MIEVIKNYVNGELIGPTSKKYIDVFEPATGKTIGINSIKEEA